MLGAITNKNIVSRYPELAVAVEVIMDGSLITSGTQLYRGQVLTKGSGGKYSPLAASTAGADCRILQEDFLGEGVDAPASAYCEGFFKQDAIGVLDADIAHVGAVKVTTNELRFLVK